MNILERTTKDTPANEAKIRGMEDEKFIFYRELLVDDIFDPEQMNEEDVRTLLIRDVIPAKDIDQTVEDLKNGIVIRTPHYRYYASELNICQSCRQPFAGKTDLCPICSAGMHEELDEVMETFPPGEERLNAIRGVKAGYGYKLVER